MFIKGAASLDAAAPETGNIIESFISKRQELLNDVSYQ
jgi:hypothetical protein